MGDQADRDQRLRVQPGVPGASGRSTGQVLLYFSAGLPYEVPAALERDSLSIPHRARPPPGLPAASPSAGSILRMHRMRCRCEPTARGRGESGGQVPATSVITACAGGVRGDVGCREPMQELSPSNADSMSAPRAWRPSRLPPITPPASSSISPPGSCTANSIRHGRRGKPVQRADAGRCQRLTPT